MNTIDEMLGKAAENLTSDLMDVLDGEDLPIGLCALLAALRDVAQQADEASVRALVVRDLRELADVLEAMDAPRH